MFSMIAATGASDGILGVFQGLDTLIYQFQSGDLKVAFGRIGLIV